MGLAVADGCARVAKDATRRMDDRVHLPLREAVECELLLGLVLGLVRHAAVVKHLEAAEVLSKGHQPVRVQHDAQIVGV